MIEKIKKNLRIRKNILFCKHNSDNVCQTCRGKISGDVSRMSGNVSGIWGNVSRIWGNVSGISGDVSGISGDVSGISANVAEIIKILQKNR